jgi:hypothetical protein
MFQIDQPRKRDLWIFADGTIIDLALVMAIRPWGDAAGVTFHMFGTTINVRMDTETLETVKKYFDTMYGPIAKPQVFDPNGAVATNTASDIVA